MQISKRSAMDIVKEISHIIGQKINLMNAEGIIIASTDEARIGTFHAAAKQLIDEGVFEKVVKHESEYEGAKPGTNLAINVHGEIVGVIGVTGPHDEVLQYGRIIKKMTEILMLEQYFKEQRAADNRIRERFLNEWFFGDGKNVNRSFLERGNSLQIDIAVPRRVIAVSMLVDGWKDDAQSQRIFDRAEHMLHELLRREKNAVWLKNAGEILCAVPDRKDTEMMLLAERIKNDMEKSCPVSVCMGVDARCEEYMLIHSSVVKAQKALKTALRSPRKGVRLYKSINMEIFQSELSNRIKSEYIFSIFKGCTVEEIAQWIALLEAFYEQEGSIAATSESMFIHKNTLQYKLNKIKEQTGYDPRSIRYSSLFYNAIHFYRDVRDSLFYSEK